MSGDLTGLCLYMNLKILILQDFEKIYHSGGSQKSPNLCGVIY